MVIWQRLLFKRLMRQEPPKIRGERCLHRRVRPISCKRCVNVCPHGALSIASDHTKGHRLFIDDHRCQGCYFCVRVCPTKVFTPSEYDHYQRLQEISVRKTPVLGCMYVDQAVELVFPCVFALEEEYLNALALKLEAEGKPSLNFYVGECSNCSYFELHPFFLNAVRRVNELLQAAGAEIRINLLWSQEEVAAHITRFNRRELLQQARRGTWKTLRELGDELLPPGRGDPMPVVWKLFLVQFNSYPGNIPVSKAPRVFRRFMVQSDRCNGCGVCVKNCFFGALQSERPGKEAVHETAEDGGQDTTTPAFKLLHFPWKCVNCGSCKRACPREALKSRRFYSEDGGLMEPVCLTVLYRQKCRACGRYFVLPEGRKLCHNCAKKREIKF